jgi:tetratricopeptide (TPR) repeat protein
MGLCYLLVLYGFLRGATEGSRAKWFTFAIVMCAVGMATKEVMVTAPVIVLLYDRTFVSGSFGGAGRRHRTLYLGLACTWIVLALLVLGAGDRGGTIGSSAGVTAWEYALCQSRGIIHYLGLALWPHPLIFDYGTDFVSFAGAAGYAVVDLCLLGLTAWALWRAPAIGFLGAFFFLILAPTTSFVGGTRQMLAEHRMYLSLAALVILIVVGLHRALGRRWIVPASLAVVALAVATGRRNVDYRSELAIYTDTVAKRPQNAYARYNLGKVLAETGRLPEAIVEDEAAVRLRPTMAPAQNNLGKALFDLGRLDEAIAHYEKAVQLEPAYGRAHYNLGLALVAAGHQTDALAHFEMAARLNPSDVDARGNWGSVLLDLGQTAAAEKQFREVLALNPDLPEARCNLGTVYLLQENFSAAADQFEAALRLAPQMTVARERLELARTRAAAKPR